MGRLRLLSSVMAPYFEATTRKSCDGPRFPERHGAESSAGAAQTHVASPQGYIDVRVPPTDARAQSADGVRGHPRSADRDRRHRNANGGDAGAAAIGQE